MLTDADKTKIVIALAPGRWARREWTYGNGRRGAGLAHIVDSIVTDNVTTACGKKMLGTLKTFNADRVIRVLDVGEARPACMTCQGIRDRRELDGA